MANHTEKEWEWKDEIIKCQPGQFKTSLESIRKNCAKKTTTKMVRTALKKLEIWHFLANEGAKQGRIITICNWKSYQGTSENESKDGGKIGADVGQDKGRMGATNNNNENVKNERERKKHLSSPKNGLSSPEEKVIAAGMGLWDPWRKKTHAKGFMTSPYPSEREKEALRQLIMMADFDTEKVFEKMDKYLALEEPSLKKAGFPLFWLPERYNQLGNEQDEAIGGWSK